MEHGKVLDGPVLPKRVLALFLDFRYTLHGLDRRLHQVAVVADGDVSPLLKVDGRVL